MGTAIIMSFVGQNTLQGQSVKKDDSDLEQAAKDHIAKGPSKSVANGCGKKGIQPVLPLCSSFENFRVVLIWQVEFG